VGLSVVRDLREVRAAAGPEEIERFETDVFAGFVLARCAAGLSDNTLRSDVSHLEQVRTWLGKPLWDMLPADADSYFGTVLRAVPIPTRLARAQALKTYFEFLELRHKIEIHNLTGRVVECPIDEINRPRGRRKAKLRIPPAAEQIARLFVGWRGELATCRKFGPVARNYAAARLMTEVGLRVNEARHGSRTNPALPNVSAPSQLGEGPQPHDPPLIFRHPPKCCIGLGPASRSFVLATLRALRLDPGPYPMLPTRRPKASKTTGRQPVDRPRPFRDDSARGDAAQPGPGDGHAKHAASSIGRRGARGRRIRAGNRPSASARAGLIETPAVDRPNHTIGCRSYCVCALSFRGSSVACGPVH
jgi:hypothetical protein